MPSARILRAGMQTTVQDLGRGAQWLGAANSGAADPIALRVANRLVGNPDDFAGLEMTYVGADLEFDAPVTIVCSRRAAILRASTNMSVEPWTVIEVGPDRTFSVRDCAPGARAYVAIAGGVDVPPVLGSRSTQVSAGLGGFQGRTLRDGDVLPIGACAGRPPRVIPARIRACLDAPERPRVLRFVANDPDGLTIGEFRVSVASDRMGVRLERLDPVNAKTPDGDLPSEPVEPGTIQATPAGELIILGVDGPPTGGYAVVGCVVLRDLGLVGQLRPGDHVRFAPTSLDAARKAWRSTITLIDAELPACE